MGIVDGIFIDTIFPETRLIKVLAIDALSSIYNSRIFSNAPKNTDLPILNIGDEIIFGLPFTDQLTGEFGNDIYF
jgi:hypothetical protein